MKNDLFIDTIKLDKDKIDDFNKYPFNIKCIKNFSNIRLNKSVTFLIGENGVGKSTFIEALAITQGLNPEGGTQNFQFKTKDTHSKESLIHARAALKNGRVITTKTPARLII